MDQVNKTSSAQFVFFLEQRNYSVPSKSQTDEEHRKKTMLYILCYDTLPFEKGKVDIQHTEKAT